MRANQLSLYLFFFTATVLLQEGTAQAVPAAGELGSDCKADAGVCNPGLFCRDGYCCDAACKNGCQACNGQDVWGEIGANGHCTLVPKFVADPDCPGYLCDHNSSFCPPHCDSTIWCAPEYYCLNASCIARKASPESCTIDEECLKGYCAKGIVNGVEAATGTCCDQPCSGNSCKACLHELTGKNDGICANVMPQILRCPVDAQIPCGNTGYCDDNGACAIHAQGPISSSCEVDAGATFSVAVVCNGDGTSTCTAMTCGAGERCVDNAGCIGNDGGSLADASPDPDVSLDGSEPSEGADANQPEADGTRDSGAKECTTLHDCIAPEICHLDPRSGKGRCGPGQPGERCWLGGDSGAFDPDGNCVLGGVPLDSPEVIGACSMVARGGRRTGWLAIAGILVSCWSCRARRRFTKTARRHGLQ
jgi:hypothetical protein